MPMGIITVQVSLNARKIQIYVLTCSVNCRVASLRHNVAVRIVWWRHHNVFSFTQKTFWNLAGELLSNYFPPKPKKTVHKGTIDKTFKSVRSLQILIILVNVSCYIIDLLHYWTLFGNKITGDSWKKACMCKMQEIWGKIFSVFMSHNNGTKLGVESMVNLWTVQAVRILHQWLIFCIGY